MKDTIKEIVIINQDSGYLMIDIANAFVDKGFSVSLITGRLVQRNIPLHSSIKISKIIKYNRNSTFKRLLTWSLASLKILWLVWFKYPNHKLFLVSNPPFWFLTPLLTKNKYLILIYDVFPDALIEFGLFSKKSKIIKLWQDVNKKVFKNAEKIFTITNGMKDALQKYAKDKNIDVVPIWTDNSFLKPLNKNDNTFVQEHNLDNNFIILYSGSLGYASQIDFLIEIANKIQNDKVKFVIIGEGVLKKKVEDKISDYGLNNCLLLPWQEVSVLPYSLASADLSVVSLGKDASKLAIPSKIFNYLSVGSPILSFSDSNSDLARLINQYEIGENFEHDQVDEIVNFINSIVKNKLKWNKMSKNSLNTSKLFTPKNAYKFIS